MLWKFEFLVCSLVHAVLSSSFVLASKEANLLLTGTNKYLTMSIVTREYSLICAGNNVVYVLIIL